MLSCNCQSQSGTIIRVSVKSCRSPFRVMRTDGCSPQGWGKNGIWCESHPNRRASFYLFICLLSLEGFLCGCLLYFNLYMLFSLKILIFRTKVCLIANRCDYIKAI